MRNEVGEFRDVIEKVKREGFVRVRVDGEILELAPAGADSAEEDRTAHDRGGGRSAGDQRRDSDAAGGFGGDGFEVGRESAWSC